MAKPPTSASHAEVFRRNPCGSTKRSYSSLGTARGWSTWGNPWTPVIYQETREFTRDLGDWHGDMPGICLGNARTPPLGRGLYHQCWKPGWLPNSCPVSSTALRAMTNLSQSSANLRVTSLTLPRPYRNGWICHRIMGYLSRKSRLNEAQGCELMRLAAFPLGSWEMALMPLWMGPAKSCPGHSDKDLTSWADQLPSLGKVQELKASGAGICMRLCLGDFGCGKNWTKLHAGRVCVCCLRVRGYCSVVFMNGMLQKASTSVLLVWRPSCWHDVEAAVYHEKYEGGYQLLDFPSGHGY